MTITIITLTGIKVKVGGHWKAVNKLYVRVGGHWKAVNKSYVRVGGHWKAVINNV